MPGQSPPDARAAAIGDRQISLVPDVASLVAATRVAVRHDPT